MNKQLCLSAKPKLCIMLLLLVCLSGCSDGGETQRPPIVTPPPVTSAPPKVTMPVDQFVNGNSQVELTVQATDDVGIESMFWTLEEGPNVSLEGTTTSTVKFTAPELEVGQSILLKFIATDAQSQQDGGFVEVFVNPFHPNASTNTVNVQAVDGIDFNDPEDPIQVVVGNTAKSLNGSGAVEMELPPLEGPRPAIITNSYGPLLMSFADETGQIEISVETSADAFVMRSPRFYGAKITDKSELSRRIRSHNSYPNLVNLIEEAVRTSFCPMKQSCSLRALRLAEEIAENLQIDDLLVPGE